MCNKTLIWVYTSAQTRQSFQCSYTQGIGVDKVQAKFKAYIPTR